MKLYCVHSYEGCFLATTRNGEVERFGKRDRQELQGRAFPSSIFAPVRGCYQTSTLATIGIILREPDRQTNSFLDHSYKYNLYLEISSLSPNVTTAKTIRGLYKRATPRASVERPHFSIIVSSYHLVPVASFIFPARTPWRIRFIYGNRSLLMAKSLGLRKCQCICYR